MCFNSNGAQIKYTIKGNSSTITFSDTNKVINVCDALHTGIVAGKMYTVTLVVKKDLGACGTYKSVDSLTKYFYMWPVLQNNTVNGCTYNWLPGYTYPYNYYYRPICGTYIGTFKSNPTQTVAVTYQDTVMLMPTTNGVGSACDVAFPPNHYERTSFLKNLPYNNWSSLNFRKYNDTYNSDSWAASVALFSGNSYDPNYICNGSHWIPLNGYGVLDINNTNKVTFVYSYPDTLTGNWVNDSFTGIRRN
ncbi:MAG: hypothetical protein HYX39_04455 [Bacteroidetes bacterium]|nr:hypothetical protein [Bacteroidota bacterium]